MQKSGIDMRYVYLICSVAALSGLLFGFDIAVINGAIVYLRDYFHLGDRQTELAASSLIFGCIGGAFVAGWLTDRYGRRRPLAGAAILFAGSSLGAGLAHTFLQFQCARCGGGIAIGVGSMLAPMYIAEASPAALRGRLVAFNQMAIVAGILLAYLINWLFSLTGGSSWRWMFIVGVFPSTLLFLGLLFVPESPRWLMEVDRSEEALLVLKKVEGSSAMAQWSAIRESVAVERSTFSDLFSHALRRPLLLVTALAILSQITGINTVLFYGSLIWEQNVKASTHSAAIGANVTIGLVNFFMTIVALWLIDRRGRKPILLVSAGALAVCEIALAFALSRHPTPVWLALGSMLMAVAAFAVGLGPCTWVLMAEMLPTRVRGRAMSIANVALWVASFALTSTFITFSRVLGIAVAFLLYSLLCVVTFVLILFGVPETKGKTLEEIETMWT